MVRYALPHIHSSEMKEEKGMFSSFKSTNYCHRKSVPQTEVTRTVIK
jgi:hypothetical protein